MGKEKNRLSFLPDEIMLQMLFYLNPLDIKILKSVFTKWYYDLVIEKIIKREIHETKLIYMKNVSKGISNSNDSVFYNKFSGEIKKYEDELENFHTTTHTEIYKKILERREEQKEKKKKKNNRRKINRKKKQSHITLKNKIFIFNIKSAEYYPSQLKNAN